MSRSLQERLDAAGAGVKLADEREAVTTALAEAGAQAKRLERTIAARVLLHHGTLDETAALVTAVPGFTMAFAARGGDLPAQEPRDVGGVGLRRGTRTPVRLFATVEDAKVVRWSLVRLGIDALKGRRSPIRSRPRDRLQGRRVPMSC